MKLYGVKNSVTREYKRLTANSTNHARKLTGWNLHDILYTLQLTTSSANKRPMPNETINATSDSADNNKESEEMMSKETLAALKSTREHTTVKPAEKAKTIKMRTTKEKKENGHATFFIFDLPATNVIRWMGKDGFGFLETIGALKALGINKLPTDGTVKAQLYHGKAGTRGEPAKLTAEQQKQLRDAAKKVEGEKKAEAKKEDKAA